MRKIGFTLLIALLACAVQPAHAGIEAFGGYWNAKDYDSLYGAGARIGFDIFKGLGIYASGAYYTTDSGETELRVIPLEAAVVWTLDVGSILYPYIGAGAGYYFKNEDKGHDIFDSDTKDCVGYFALGGLKIKLGPVYAFGEVKYTLVQEDDEWTWRGSDVEEKYSLDGFSAQIGLGLGF